MRLTSTRRARAIEISRRRGRGRYFGATFRDGEAPEMGMAMMQRMQRELARIQEELAKEVVEATAGGGAVKVQVTGQLEFKSIEISPEVVDPEDVEMLQDLIMAATRDAFARAKDLQTKRLGALTGGMKIPGLT